MTDADNDFIEGLLKDFQKESLILVEELLHILEACDGDYGKVLTLETYGQTVDRIMGGAQSIAIHLSRAHLISKISDCAEVCKAVGYKASQILGNAEFYNVSVSFLLDATETLEQMVEDLSSEEAVKSKEYFNKTFVDRLKWLSSKFNFEMRGTLDISKGAKLAQFEIDEIIKKLGHE